MLIYCNYCIQSKMLCKKYVADNYFIFPVIGRWLCFTGKGNIYKCVNSELYYRPYFFLLLI